MNKKINPYESVGELDPFGVAHRFNLPFALAQAFKKLMFAGIDGRLKSVAQDYKEAAYSIERGIKDIPLFDAYETINERINPIFDLYAKVFPDANENAVSAARSILLFAQFRSESYLHNALNLAKKAVEDASRTGS